MLRGRLHWIGLVCMGALALGACSPVSSRGADAPGLDSTADGGAASPDPVAAKRGADGDGADPAYRVEIERMLAEVSRYRQLAAKRKVNGMRLTRAQVIARITAKAERDLPKGVLEAQGELLRAFELTPVGYDFVGGIYALIKGNVAGLYDPDDGAMILLDDLRQTIVAQTLAHELVHALQDQHYDLKQLLKYTAGQTDRVGAGHALAEGDATAAMLDMTQGVGSITPAQLRLALVASVALSDTGHETPRVLQASLVAPYVDGFTFVQALRARGGWAEVDRAWRRLPASTEQLLHLDKYYADEKPLMVPEPPMPDSGFRSADADVLGEQGLRLSLEQWTIRKKAIAAAAGWGGDRYLVADREGPAGTRDIAVAWHLRFDSEADSREAAAVFRKAFPKACKERKDLGPLAWQRRGDAIAMVAGPYRRERDGTLRSVSRCAPARKWLDAVLQKR
jgi:hypothetical protein